MTQSRGIAKVWRVAEAKNGGWRRRRRRRRRMKL
jgi:hypothetical protein